MMFDLILDVMNGFKAKIGSTVPLGRGYFLIIPGTSCLATIVLSLRDKRHSTAEALLIFAPFNPRLNPTAPQGIAPAGQKT
jgi:hypothetical protein